MNELIDKYLQYKSLLNDLQTESEQIKNEIYKVDETKNKIVLHKLQHDEIL
jgi:prefoldin subunit 5